MKQTKRPRILLADDHPVLLEGLEKLLSPEFDIVASVADGHALVQAAEATQPDVAVIDISMPALNGIEATRELRHLCPATRVLILTMHKEIGLLKEALWAGADGYVLKESVCQDIITAVRKVLSGGNYLSPSIRNSLEEPATELTARKDQLPGRLTPRQVEILELIAGGKSMKEIAATLGITLKTVEFHKYGAMKKLNLKTTADLIRYTVRRGIGQPE